MVKNINFVRKKYKEKIWLFNILIIAIFFISSYVSQLEFIFVPRLLSVIYFLIAFYALLNSRNSGKFGIRYPYLMYCIGLQSLFLAAIEIEEKGLNLYLVVVTFNVLMSLISLRRINTG